MPSRVNELTPERIAELTRKADQRESARTHKSRWMTATDAKVVIEAIEKRKSEVVIGNDVFIITRKDNGNFFIKPRQHGKFVPCGEYSLGSLMSLAA